MPSPIPGRERLKESIFVTPEHGKTVLISQRSVEAHVIEVVLVVPEFRNKHLDLVRLHLMGEDLANSLRIGVGEALPRHVGRVRRCIP